MSIDIYLQQISGESIVSSKDEEKNLNDEELVMKNLKFVVQIANDYKTMLPLNDLIQEGNRGLIEAAKKFDRAKNIKFITYAVYYIRKYMRKAITDNRTVLKKSRNKNIVIEPIDDVLEDQLSQEKDITYAPDNILIQKEEMEYLKGLFPHLDTIEVNVLCKIYGIDGDKMKLIDIAKEYDYSIPGICAIERRAINKLKKIV